MKRHFVSFSAACILVVASLGSLAAQSSKEAPSMEPRTPRERHAFSMLNAPSDDSQPFVPEHVEHCVNGSAGGYPCERVDLLEVMPTAVIGGGSGSDLWGWTDPMTGNEYALMGRSNGTSFIDITDPENPIYLGNLPTNSGTTAWRDIKTYQNHAYIVSDYNGAHGMQVFDLTELRSVVSPPATFTASVYGDFSAHNIVINEDSGYGYAVGISSGTNACAGGLHMIDLSTPASPSFVGCFSGDGYTHDAQCVNYAGPDSDHAGAEVCFNSNEDSPEHIGWEIVTNRKHSGDRSLFSTYVDNQCTWMATPILRLTPGQSPLLSFWTAFDIENQWDGGVVQTSTDGGASWTTLAMDQGYPGTFNSGGDACGFLSGDPSFTGEGQLTWTEYTADLSAFAGQDVQIRWIFSTDTAVTEEGWYVDDIAISHVEVPGICNPPLFADGFETGDTQGWASSQP